jgi:hypothetical protein
LESLQSVVTKFLRNNKHPDYVTIVAKMLEKSKVLGCLISLKIHFLNLHLDFSPTNLGAVNDEQGERFHQDNEEMERRYHSRWNVNVMETSQKKSNILSFTSKRRRQ